MRDPGPDVPAAADPRAQMERTLMAEYLRARGHDWGSVRALPEAEARALLRDASLHASARLTEIESRAHLVSDLHGDADLAAQAPHRRRS